MQVEAQKVCLPVVGLSFSLFFSRTSGGVSEQGHGGRGVEVGENYNVPESIVQL